MEVEPTVRDLSSILHAGRNQGAEGTAGSTKSHGFAESAETHSYLEPTTAASHRGHSRQAERQSQRAVDLQWQLCKDQYTAEVTSVQPED